MTKIILLNILCLVKQHEDYLSISDIIERITKPKLKPLRIETLKALKHNIARAEADIYLIEDRYFQKITNASLNSKPIIVIVDDFNSGIKALASGATEFIEKNKFTAIELEKSLNLSLARTGAIETKKTPKLRADSLTTLVELGEKLLESRQNPLENERIIELLAGAIEADRIAFFKYDRATMVMNLTAEWAACKQTNCLPKIFDRHSIEILAAAQIYRGIRAIKVADCDRFEFVAILIFPLIVAGKLFGAICLENCQQMETEIIPVLEAASKAISLKLESSIAEIALGESKETFHTIFNRAGVGIAQLDLNYKFLLVNQKLSQLTGYNSSEFTRLTVKDITHPEDIEKQILLEEQILAGKIASFSQEKRYICKNGNYIWVNVTVSIIKDRSKKAKYMIKVIEDINDRKIAEVALRNSEKRLHSIANSLPVCIAYVDAEQSYQFVNKNYYNWFGYAPQEICGQKKVKEVLGEQNYNAIADRIARVLQGEEVTYQSIIVCENRERYVNGTLVPDFDENNQVKGYYSLIADISAQKQTEEKLRASEALYAGIFNHSADGIFSLDVLPDGEFVYEAINPTYEMLRGTSVAEIVGKKISQVVSPETLPMLTRLYRSCVATGEPIAYEQTLELPQGNRIWRTILVPIRDRNGKIVKLQGSARDITQEKEIAAKQIRFTRHQRLLASLTLQTRQSWHIDEILQTAVTEIRRTLKAERVLFVRLEKDSLTGTVVNEDVDSDYPAIVGETIINQSCYQQCQTKYQSGYIHISSDVLNDKFEDCYLQFLQKYQVRAHLIVPISISPKQSDSPSISKQAKLWGLLCVQQCSSPRQWKNEEIELLQQLADRLSIALYQSQLLEQQEQQRQELQRSNAELEQFAYVASHDLQEPLQTVASYAQLLQRRYQERLDPKADKYIYYIVDGVGRMQRQIKDLLEYSRIGKKDRTFDEVDCNLIFKQAISNLQSTIRQHRAVVITKNLPRLKANSAQILQLFQNLIGNALKYHRQEPPVIIIQAELKENGWLFSIADNGIGIDSKHKKLIFQFFLRLHARVEYPGTGIGLAICEKIVKHHGGKIWVDSQPNFGSTFYFTLAEMSE